MNINQEGLKIIKQSEGCRLTAYKDVRGITTIGWGHVPARVGQTMTQAEADAMLVADVQHFRDAVWGLVHDVPTTENQFSAMISLTYNIGATAFRSSSVLRLHRQKAYAQAGDAFKLWDKTHIDGRLVDDPPLLRRREQERTLYLTAQGQSNAD